MRKRILAAWCGTFYAAFCFVLAIALGEFTIHPVQVPIDKKPKAQAMAARFGAELKDVSITSPDGTKLQGWFIRPERAIGDAIILLHGIGDNRQGMIGFAELFLSHGYTILMPDSRGQGESGGLPTYGLKEKNDIRQWFSWLHQQEKPGCIFGMGESLGAAIMLQAIKEVPFCAAVAESPFANFRDIAYIRVGQFFHTGPWLGRIILRPAIEVAFAYCRLKYGIPLSNISPEMSVVGNHIPILLIHGLSDENIPIRQSEMIARQCPGSIDFWKVPNAGHCGAINAAGREFKQCVLAWFLLYGSHPGNTAEQSKEGG
jgi:uncharacterized protein